MFERRLAGWKKNFLSKGGRYTLIRTTLMNLPIYFLSTITIPVKVAKKLEAIECCFLWGDEEGNRKYHLVNWGDIKKPIMQGGLGIKSIVELNVALKAKWLWIFVMEEDRLWRKIITVRWGDLLGRVGTDIINKKA